MNNIDEIRSILEEKCGEENKYGGCSHGKLPVFSKGLYCTVLYLLHLRS